MVGHLVRYASISYLDNLCYMTSRVVYKLHSPVTVPLSSDRPCRLISRRRDSF